jgi:hypothetical protein
MEHSACQSLVVQVLACSLVGTAIALSILLLDGGDGVVDFDRHPRRSYLLCAYIGHYACCNGDTWWVVGRVYERRHRQ